MSHRLAVDTRIVWWDEKGRGRGRRKGRREEHETETPRRNRNPTTRRRTGGGRREEKRGRGEGAGRRRGPQGVEGGGVGSAAFKGYPKPLRPVERDAGGS